MFHFVSLPFIAAKIDPDGSLEANMEGIMTTPQAKLSAGSLKQQRLADSGTASKKKAPNTTTTGVGSTAEALGERNRVVEGTYGALVDSCVIGEFDELDIVPLPGCRRLTLAMSFSYFSSSQ